MILDIKLAFDIFKMGIDYGQLLCEDERFNEELFDGFQGCIIDKKYSMPSHQAPRRQLHSEAWHEAKRKSKNDFEDLLIKIAKEQEVKKQLTLF